MNPSPLSPQTTRELNDTLAILRSAISTAVIEHDLAGAGELMRAHEAIAVARAQYEGGDVDADDRRYGVVEVLNALMYLTISASWIVAAVRDGAAVELAQLALRHAAEALRLDAGTLRARREVEAYQAARARARQTRNGRGYEWSRVTLSIHGGPPIVGRRHVAVKSLVKRLRESRSLTLAMKVATDIVPKLPERGDGPINVAVKLVSILDTLRRFGDSAGLRDFAGARGLVEATNAHFVETLFGTSLREAFELRRVPVGDHQEIVEATGPFRGTLFFLGYNYGGRTEYASEFYYTEGFDFDALLERLWAIHGGRIHLAVAPGRYGETKPTFMGFEAPADATVIYGANEARLQREVARLGQYRHDGIARAYLMLGAPGTGKTSFALRMAQAIGGRTLKVDAASLSHVQEREFRFVLDHLRPDFLLVDDIDKASVEKAVPTLLSLLESLRRQHPNTTVFLTANGTEKLDPGLLRPGRVDRKLEFALPSYEERRAILVGYLDAFGLELGDEDLERCTLGTEGMSGAYVREVPLGLRYDPVDDVLPLVQELHSLVRARDEKAKPKAPAAEAS